MRFISLLLCLLYVLLALGEYFACAHEGSQMHGNGLIAAEENIISTQMDVIDVAATKSKLSGRKLMMDMDEANSREEMLINKDLKERDNIAETTSKISGKDTNAPERSTTRSDDHFNDQNKSHKLKQNPSKTPSLKTPRRKNPSHFTNTRLHRFQQSKDKPAKQASKDKSQGLLDRAAEEIVSLMGKDYRGNGNPRRKPPINNHEPTD